MEHKLVAQFEQWPTFAKKRVGKFPGFVQVKLAMKIPWSAGTETTRSIHLKPWLFLHLKHLCEKETGLPRDFTFYTQVPIYPRSPSQPLNKIGNFTHDYLLRSEI